MMTMRFVWIGSLLFSIMILSGCSSAPVSSRQESGSSPVSINELEKKLRAGNAVPNENIADGSAPQEQANPTNQQQSKVMNNKKQYTVAPTLQIDVTKSYSAVVHTDSGDITIALNAKMTPKTVNNFVFLAKEGFYDGTIFHRTIKGFMIQGGDPEGTGRGGPGYQFDDELFSGEYKRGTVAMANAGPDTNGSQFFIMHADYALPPNYVIFGQVTDGLDVVDKIATAPTSATGEQSTPVTPVTVRNVDIRQE